MNCEVVGCPLKLFNEVLSVPSDGPKPAPVLFVGEAPGFEEEREGKPFVGPAGQLVREALKRAQLLPENCCLTNLVGCRPVDEHNGQRRPTKQEFKACFPNFKRVVENVNPRIIIASGAIVQMAIKSMQASGVLPTCDLVPVSAAGSLRRKLEDNDTQAMENFMEVLEFVKEKYCDEARVHAT